MARQSLLQAEQLGNSERGSYVSPVTPQNWFTFSFCSLLSRACTGRVRKIGCFQAGRRRTPRQRGLRGSHIIPRAHTHAGARSWHEYRLRRALADAALGSETRSSRRHTSRARQAQDMSQQSGLRRPAGGGGVACAKRTIVSGVDGPRQGVQQGLGARRSVATLDKFEYECQGLVRAGLASQKASRYLLRRGQAEAMKLGRTLGNGR